LASAFFAVFLGMGGLFTVLIGRSVWEMGKTYRWTRAEAQILGSAARQRPAAGDVSKPYEFTVEYRYLAGGEWRTGTRWSTKEGHFERMEDAQRLAERFRAGARVDCWRDPAGAGAAVLERQSPLYALVLLFPMIFVAVGLIGTIAVWRARKSPARGAAMPVSERARVRGPGTGFLRLVCLLFLGVGAGVLWVMTLGPLLDVLAARSWTPTPARVLSSRVVAHSDSDGSTYRVDILYAYTLAGVPRQSSRYDFSRGSSSGYGTKAAIVSQYPAGAETICYVDPRDPTQAVLRREPFRAMGFGAIGLVFLLLGGLGAAGAGRISGERERPRADGLPATVVAVEGGGPVVLRPQQTRLGKFRFMLVFAVVWNAFIGVFGYLLLVRDPGAAFSAKLLIGALGLAGLGLVGGVIYQALALFNPVVRLTVEACAMPLGSEWRLGWTVAGHVSKLRRLRIELEGREEATYRRGTSTYTDREVFCRQVLVEAGERAQIETGQTVCTVPAGSMHTFEGGNNKVRGRLHGTGEIPRWPDIDDEYPVTILPREMKSEI